MSSTAHQMSGITRTDLQRHDFSAPGREVIQNRVGISPEAPLVKHWHPGEEIIYVLEGALEYQIEGEPPRTVKAGEALMVPAETVHAVRNVGGGDAAELATYIAEKGSRSSRSSTERTLKGPRFSFGTIAAAEAAISNC
jgi:quercetin dioxygenase-like cupin family protein